MKRWQDKNGNKLFAYERIERLDLEFNNTCFLFCGGCARTFNPKIEAAGKLLMSVDDVQRFFPPEFCQQLHYVLSCGNWGDSIAHPDCLEILQWFRTNGVKNIAFSTNGSARSPQWWADLAKMINAKPRGYWGGRVTFSIDGLEDTNHLYKVGSKWHRIMENAQAYIDAGGRARWQFIIMNHNEHQIDEARDLAREMGFDEFVEKTSFRFASTKMDQKHAELLAEEAEMKILLGKKGFTELLDRTPTVVDKNIIESPINISLTPENLHPDRERLAKMHDTYKTEEDFFTNAPKVICQNKGCPRIYVGADGKVWPCNWLGGMEYYSDNKPHWPPKSLTEHGIPLDFNNLYKYKHFENPMKEVLSHPWFTDIFEQDLQCPELTPVKCKQTCNTEIGDGAFERMRRNEINLKTGIVKDMNEIHGLTKDQGVKKRTFDE